MRVFKRIILSSVLAATLAACGDNPPVTDFSSAQAARESFDRVAQDLSDGDRDLVVDALTWALLTTEGRPEESPETREHAALRADLAALSDAGVVERLSAAGFDGLSGPALLQKARDRIARGVGIEMARAGVALDDARQPIETYRTAADSARTTLSPLHVSDAAIDRGVIHQADRARLRATVENRFDRPVVRLTLKAAIRDAEAGVNADSRITVRLDRPLLPGRRTTVEGYGGLGDGIDGDVAARYAGQRHRDAVSVVAERVEFDDGGSIGAPRRPAPGVFARIDRIRQRHQEWIDRYRMARGMTVDWSATNDMADTNAADDDEDSEQRQQMDPGEADQPVSAAFPGGWLLGSLDIQESRKSMTNSDTREIINNEIT